MGGAIPSGPLGEVLPAKGMLYYWNSHGGECEGVLRGSMHALKTWQILCNVDPEVGRGLLSIRWFPTLPTCCTVLLCLLGGCLALAKQQKGTECSLEGFFMGIGW